MASSRRAVDNAIDDLVTSIVGRQPRHSDDTNNSAISMARRILDSSIGASNQNMAAAWKRSLERSAAQERVTELHRRLERASGDPETADKVLVVLTRLANNGSSNQQQQQQQQQSTANLYSAKPYTYTYTTSNSTYPAPTIPMNKEQQILALHDDETLLLRECLYALQGMNGDHLFYHENDYASELQCHFGDNEACHDPTLVMHSNLGNGAHRAFRLCGQAGWYYRRIQAYIDGISSTCDSANDYGSAVARAWAEALSTQLNFQYHSLLADLEAQLQEEEDEAEEGAKLSLRQLVIRLQQPIAQLKTLAVLTDGLSGLKGGGPLLTALEQHSLHGDSRHVAIVQNMLAAASQPWYLALYIWSTKGILMAGGDAFFIRSRNNTTVTSSSGIDLWHNTFEVLEDQVPTILPHYLVETCLNVGKGINFIRHCLCDAGWNVGLGGEYDDDESLEKLGFYYRQTPSSNKKSFKLTQTLRLVEEQVNCHIVQSLREQHHMVEHLRALKQFMLLGQGDFFSVLMEGLHAEFDFRKDGIIGLYDYALMGIVDGALKSTNATNMPPYVLQRLRVKLTLDEDDDTRFQFGPPKDGSYNKDARTGWDIFTLEYQVPDPLKAIVHERAMEQYRRLFSMLFGLKRVESMLNMTWRQSTDLHHAIQIFAQYNAINISKNAEYAKTTALLRHISMTRQSMMHFVVNLKSYLLFEVLEGGWKTLSTKLMAGSSLDDFILAHDTYLEDIVQKSLLGSDDIDDAVAEGLAVQLQTLLRLALEFCTFQEELFRTAIRQAERATQKRKEAEKRSKQGDWGFSSEQDVQEAKTFFGLTDESKMKEVRGLGREFNQGTHGLLTQLHEISHGRNSATAASSTPKSVSTNESIATSVNRDHFNHDSLHFLMFQLDYSGFYNVGD